MWTVNTQANPKNNNNNNPYFNFINNSSYENTQSTNPKKQINDYSNKYTPIQFGFNFYFNNIKSSSPFTPINCSKDQNFIKINNINQKIPFYFIFKSSLEKSGYKVNSEQFNENNNEIFNENNNFNEDNNYYNFPLNTNYSINNNKIINNIYPTITKVTNVKILSDNNPNNISYEKIDDIKLENKKENINHSIQNVNINEKDSKKEENKLIINTLENKDKNITDKKTKIIFECSESNISMGKASGIKFIKKKRFRKNNEQINHLSKFYKEHKIWTKSEIKEMSKNIGLKENKIYKWLWDQKNKEYNKSTKFIINKK